MNERAPKSESENLHEEALRLIPQIKLDNPEVLEVNKRLMEIYDRLEEIEPNKE